MTAGWRELAARVPPSAWVLLALLVVCAVAVPRFATGGNLVNVLRVAAILALAAYGQSLVIITGGLDFSVGSSVALTSVVTIMSIPVLGTPLSFALGALAALAVGVVNGAFVSRFRIPAFLVTLGTLIGVHGIASMLAGGIPLEAPAGVGFAWLGRGAVWGVPVPVIVAAAGFAVLALLLGHTRVGRSWYLAGSGPRAARLAGVRVTASLFAAYVCAAVFVAVAGMILTARVASGQPNLYPTLPFESIAACAIGGLPLSGGTGTASQVLVGVLVVAVVNNAVVLLNLAPAVQLMVIGVLTVLAVVLQQVDWQRARPRLRAGTAAGSRR